MRRVPHEVLPPDPFADDPDDPARELAGYGDDELADLAEDAFFDGH